MNTVPLSRCRHASGSRAPLHTNHGRALRAVS
jgi:hypothetical protein